MESEMVERVALAVHEKNCEGDVDVKEDFYSQPDWWQRIAFDHAIASIQAMREPSEGMVNAAEDQLAGDGNLVDLYVAMIDAALSGQSGMGEG